MSSASRAGHLTQNIGLAIARAEVLQDRLHRDPHTANGGLCIADIRVQGNTPVHEFQMCVHVFAIRIMQERVTAQSV